MVSVGTTSQAIGIWVVIGKENDTQNHRVHFGSFVLSYLWFVLYGCVVRVFLFALLLIGSWIYGRRNKLFSRIV